MERQNWKGKPALPYCHIRNGPVRVEIVISTNTHVTNLYLKLRSHMWKIAFVYYRMSFVSFTNLALASRVTTSFSAPQASILTSLYDIAFTSLLLCSSRSTWSPFFYLFISSKISSQSFGSYTSSLLSLIYCVCTVAVAYPKSSARRLVITITYSVARLNKLNRLHTVF